MRKICIMFLSVNLLWNTLLLRATALDVPEPYIVTQSINYETIPLEECLILLQNPLKDEEGEGAFLSERTVAEVEADLQMVQGQYNDLNDEISALESGESDSLDWANGQLMYVIEEVYTHYFESDPDFGYLTEEEQLVIVSNHDVVIEWQAYTYEIQALINQKIADRDVLEQAYSNLNYTYNDMQVTEENNAETKAQYNQCQIYPYSSEYMSPDQILLNNQVLLNDYLVQIDSYLQKLVAKAYRKVSFDDIYRLYTQQLSVANEDSSLENKANIVLDSLAYESYSYAKELSLIDIETLAQYAQRAYVKNQKLDEFIKSYQKVIQLKENQWQYIYQINPAAFEMIKAELVNYLNMNDFTDEYSIEMVRSIHQRYQVKLVFYDDATKSWILNETASSGYLDEYMSKEISLDKVVDDVSSITDVESSDESFDLSRRDPGVIMDETDDNLPSPNSNLDALKNQLSNVRNNTGVKSLDKPDSSSLKDKSTHSSDKSNGKIELPSTGERRPFTIIAIVILVVGILLILISTMTKRKNREKLDEIDLD